MNFIRSIKLCLLIMMGLLYQSCKENKSRPVTKNERVILTAADTLLAVANKNIDENYIDEAVVKLNYALSIDGSNLKTIGELYGALGYCYIQKENYYKSLENYLLAISYFNIARDSQRLAQMQLNSATCYKVLGFYDKAAKDAIAAKTYFSQDIRNRKNLAISFNLLGNIHNRIKNFNKASFYYKESIKIRKTIPGFSISSPVNNVGLNFFKLEQYDSALTYYKNYLKLARIEKSANKTARAYGNLAETYLVLGNRKVALQFLDSADAIYRRNNSKFGLTSIHLIKADYYFLENLNQAEIEAGIALELSKELGKIEHEQAAINKLSLIYTEKNQLKKALQYSQKYNQLKETSDMEEKLNKIMSYEMLSQLDKKNEEIHNIEKEKRKTEEESQKKGSQRNFLIVLVLFVASLLYIVYKQYIEKKRFVDEYFASEKGVILKSGKKIAFDNIIKVETIRNDLILFTEQGKIVEKSTTLKSFLPSLPKIQFGRPQRGIIVNFKKLDKVLKTKIELKGETINISATYKEQFIEDYDAFKGKKN